MLKKMLCTIVGFMGLYGGSEVLASPTDIFISEYVEGSGNNKVLELYNGTNAAIDLSTGQYVLQLFFNGNSSSTSTITLTGTIPAGGTFVVAHTSASLGTVTVNQSSGSLTFNGNDAIVLRKGGTSGQVLDVIGQVGFDPGTEWGTGTTTTLDHTLRRMTSVCQGDTSMSNVFNPATEWDGFAVNTFSGLGAHSTTCAPAGPGISTNPTSLSFSATAGTPSAPQTYSLSGNGLTANVSVTAPAQFEVSLTSGGTYSGSLSVPFASVNTAPVTIYTRYNPTVAGTHTGNIAHSSGTYTTQIALSGNSQIHTIPQVQGSAMASTMTGNLATIEGTVTGDFQNTGQLGGFFVQDSIGDGNPLTSDGIFVANTSFAVNTGDKVRLTGTVEESFNRTQIGSVTALTVISTGHSVATTTVTLPVQSVNILEQYEGMQVRFTQTLTVSEVYNLGRYGEVLLSANGRLFNPTNMVDPNDNPATGTSSTGNSNAAAVTAMQDLNNRSQILLDDASNTQNPATVPFTDTSNTLRCGSTAANLTGILDFAFSVYRLQPTIAPAFQYAARPTVPDVGQAEIRIASFNVLNYFNGNGSGGGFPTARGANTATEFARQRTKIIAAIKALDADVTGLMEMENDGNTAQSAIADLVDGLNAATAPGTYAFVQDPTPANGGTGTDAIKVALIYQPAQVTPNGVAKADNNPAHNRPPLAQTFTATGSGKKFSVIVNHFKSKGCTGASGADADQNDGQSCFNDARKQQAAALLNFVQNVKTTSADSNVLLIGDFNAYEQEDPIDMMLAGGMKNVLANTYSYVFMGQSGSLDHALATDSMLGRITGAAKWHINADEPLVKDYNQEFNPAYMYSADAFRSSDHDPVLIGLKFTPAVTPTGLTEAGTTASFNVWPNPVKNGQLFLDIPAAGEQQVQVRLFNSMSMLVMEQSLQQHGQNRLMVTLPSVAPGMYLLQVTYGRTTGTRKILVQP
jgi:predicted extracellular nuclease